MAARGFRHEALFYSGEDSFLAGTLPFILDGLTAGEPVMVAVSPEKIELLMSSLDGSSDAVTFADMQELGRNPALMLPAWEDFIARHATGGRRVRGIGEPVWAERTHPEVSRMRAPRVARQPRLRGRPRSVAPVPIRHRDPPARHPAGSRPDPPAD